MMVKVSVDMTEYKQMVGAAEYAVETGQMSEIEAQDTLFAFIRLRAEDETEHDD